MDACEVTVLLQVVAQSRVEFISDPVWITFELLSLNLYEFIKLNNFVIALVEEENLKSKPVK